MVCADVVLLHGCPQSCMPNPDFKVLPCFSSFWILASASDFKTNRLQTLLPQPLCCQGRGPQCCVLTSLPSRGTDVTDIIQSGFLLLFILFLCLFLSFWPFQLYFILFILPTTLRFLTVRPVSYLPYRSFQLGISLWKSPSSLISSLVDDWAQTTNWLTN